MNDLFTSCGKQVLRDGKHFADCLTSDDAETLAVLCATAMRAVSEQPRGRAGERLAWAGERLCATR